MSILFPLILFFLILGGICAFGYFHYVKPSRMLDQLTNSSTGVLPSSLFSNKANEFSFATLLEPIGNLLPVSPQDALAAKRELIAAGFRSGRAVAVYSGVKILVIALFVLLGLWGRTKIANPLSHVVLPVAAGGIGYLVPGFGLDRLVKRRHDKIRHSLPDVLDLLVICTEAGCGLDQAIVNVSRELKTVHPAVSEELAMVNMEIMAGTNRADALRNFGRRTNEDEIKKLVAILIQTDKFGTSVAEALRTQSDFLRVRRRQEAEERAGKVGVKLVFPIFFFCLPSLMVVAAGPGILQIVNNLLPAMQGR